MWDRVESTESSSDWKTSLEKYSGGGLYLIKGKIIEGKIYKC